MTHTMTDEKDIPTPVNEDDVIAWLRDNPNFLQRNPELCDLLAPPREYKGKGVIDFQQFMVNRLRQDRDGIIEEARDIVETSRANMNNLSRIHTAVLMVLEARDFDDFIHTLVMDCASILNVDIMTLVVEAEDGVVPHINVSGVYAVSPGSINLLMKDASIMLEANIRGLGEVYGGGAGLVKSQALVRMTIDPSMPPAMLCFGSRDPELFQAGQATDLLGFFAHVVERQFRAWLDVPTGK